MFPESSYFLIYVTCYGEYSAECESTVKKEVYRILSRAYTAAGKECPIKQDSVLFVPDLVDVDCSFALYAILPSEVRVVMPDVKSNLEDSDLITSINDELGSPGWPLSTLGKLIKEKK